MSNQIASLLGYTIIPLFISSIFGFCLRKALRSSVIGFFIYGITAAAAGFLAYAPMLVTERKDVLGIAIALGVSLGMLLPNILRKPPRAFAEPDDHVFEMANVEFEQSRNHALWVKCLALANGDELVARYSYIKEVARRQGGKLGSGKDSSSSPIEDTAGFYRRLVRGDFGLAKTLWLGLVGYWAVNGAASVAISSIAISVSPATRLDMIKLIPGSILIHVFIFSSLIIGTWRASSKYEGEFFWVIVARLVLMAAFMLMCAGVVVSYGIYRSLIGQF